MCSCIFQYFVVPLQQILDSKNMDTMNAIILLAVIAEVLLLIICIIGYRVAFLKRQLTDLRIKMVISQREEQMRHQILIDQIKKQKNVNALDNLQNLFADKNKEIKRIYPALTETDMQVVTLIGLGVDNSDILQLTDMSKRTYYKRRQLIAQRMNTTAALLDEAISPFFTLKLK